MSQTPYLENAIHLLKKLIETPSISKDEEKTATILAATLEAQGLRVNRHVNNVWATNLYFDNSKPTILLNSHHDTVKPNSSYTRNPFEASIDSDVLYGLGSNDAGGALVSLWACFSHFSKRKDLNFNLVFAATAEEEISGKNGIESILDLLPKIAFGIVGEPTSLQIATAEKGLLVLDCMAKGLSGHAARNEGKNAIYEALLDIEWFRTFQFPKVSDTLGPIHMNVTLINAGTQHNVVPDACSFTVDLRLTEAYSIEETLSIIRANVKSEITPRGTRLKPSSINANHPIVKKGLILGLETYGSPTLSDQALMPFETIKIGPGDSARSHMADEFIYLSQIESGIQTYINLLEGLVL